VWVGGEVRGVGGGGIKERKERALGPILGTRALDT